MNLQKTAFRLNRKIHQLYFRLLRRRPASKPYLSGDTFRSLADHVYEEGLPFNPEQVASDSTIFVASPQAEKFFTKIHPRINNDYTLITHNGDNIIDDYMSRYIDRKIVKWYAMSVLTNHPKIVPIPAGLENLHYYNNGITRLFDKHRKRNNQKLDRILFGFTVSTNPKERQPAYDFLHKYPLADEITKPLNADEYLDHLSCYKFVAAPPGNAIESHRMWEAMYLGVVPIVKRSRMMEYFRDLGLPIWLINDWFELSSLTPDDLSLRYRKIMKEARTEALWFSYWQNRIRNRQ